MKSEKLGWILIHSGSHFGDGDYDTPKEQLKREKPKLWHWNRVRPLNEGMGYIYLFAWKGEIFAEADADITHNVEYPDFNFAFRLGNYREIKKTIRLDDLPVPRKPRDLIKLTPNILAAYRRKTGTPLEGKHSVGYKM